jgi:hypothetical protein
MTLAALDRIRASRDAALSSLGESVEAVSNNIATTTETGTVLDRLIERRQDLSNKREAIRTAATDAVLEMPTVLAAAQTLNRLATGMQAEAAALPNAANFLASTARILTLGQNFLEIIASGQRP